MRTSTLNKNSNKRSREEEESVEEAIEKLGNPTFDVDHLLSGLNLTSAGNVRVDEVLLKKLRGDPIDPPNPPPNPLAHVPEFLDVMKPGKEVTSEDLDVWSKRFNKDKNAVNMAEMIGNLPLEWLALRRSEMEQDDWEYSIKTTVDPRVTDQYHSGRCWMFSALNQLRYGMMNKFDVDYKFEFSGSYLFFYDKIERANFFLESIWSLRERELDDRYIKIFTDEGQYMSDGGYFQYFINLVNRYGVVPKSLYNDSYNCLTSDYMNDTLQTVLNHMALEIHKNRDKWTRKTFERKKQKWRNTIYNLMARFMGEPPKPDTKFTWKFKDSNGTIKTIPDLTPKSFYNVWIPHNHDTKITLIHDPRHEYYRTHLIEYGNNMVGGVPANFLNVPIDVMKAAIRTSLENDDPVWFANDVGKCLDFENNTLDTKRFDYKAVLGTDTTFDKADMLQMSTSIPSHAMVLCGVDPDLSDENSGYGKWRVENSWGIDCEMEWAKDHGYWKMTDEHFDQYTFMAVVDLKYLDEETAQNIINNKGEAHVYKPWDAFGTVARGGCKHCGDSKYEKKK